MNAPPAERRRLNSPDVLPAAIHVIHYLIVQARLVALDWTHGRAPVNPGLMAEMLDAIEIFPELIKNDFDGAYEHFRELLAGYGPTLPGCSALLEEFDRRVAEAEAGRPNGSVAG
jgi:hypothetical protein